MHEAKLAKMEAEMKMVFQQKVQEKEAKLKQSEEELYARHREMKEALEKQRVELDDKKRKIESGRPITPEKINVSTTTILHFILGLTYLVTADKKEGFPPHLSVFFSLLCLHGMNLADCGYLLPLVRSCFRILTRNGICYSLLIVSF